MVAYKSAFLRTHYPAEFMASVISNGGGYYSTFGYLSEARRMGLTILPPHINRSEIKYTGKNKEIRVGLMQLKDRVPSVSECCGKFFKWSCDGCLKNWKRSGEGFYWTEPRASL
jgi:DNA polymerase III alpha subunit